MIWQDFALCSLTSGALIWIPSSWLGKVWANRILEKDRARYQTQIETLIEDMRTRDSKELFVHRLQFENVGWGLPHQSNIIIG
jgi:hypothetical protein